MKRLYIILFSALLLHACSKRLPATEANETISQPHYDTMAVDSFSNGAVSVDVARQIRMSSQKYKDSVKQALKVQQEEKRIKDEVDKENKKKTEEEKNKNTEKPLKESNQ